MDCKRLFRSSWTLAIIFVTIGCSREGFNEPRSVTDDAASAPLDVGSVVVEDMDPEIVLASAVAEMSSEADGFQTIETSSIDGGISLNDAHVANQLIAMYFPARSMRLSLDGVLSDINRGIRARSGSRASPSACVWALDRGEADSRITVAFKLRVESESENDIPLHVAIDRVIYIHISQCLKGENRTVTPDQFEIDGVGIIALFQECDERARRYWNAEERLLDPTSPSHRSDNYVPVPAPSALDSAIQSLRWPNVSNPVIRVRSDNDIFEPFHGFSTPSTSTKEAESSQLQLMVTPFD